MLKQFFISMLGSIAGFFLAGTIFFFGLLIIIPGMLLAAAGSSSATSINKNSYLHLVLEGEISEREMDASMMDILTTGLPGGNLEDIVTAINWAKDDKRIKGIFIDCKGSTAGIASRYEIIEALKRFKEAEDKDGNKKWIYAYADNYEQGDYYIATVADKLYVNPVGDVNVHGVMSSIPFFTNLLKKVGVEVQVVKVGDFKSAVEPFILTHMSDSSRYQTQVFLDDIWGCIKDEIAESRDVKPEDVDTWANEFAFTWAADRYVDHRIVTELKYRSEVEAMIREKLNVKDKDDLPAVTVADYIALNASKAASSQKKHIAVLYAVGDIVQTGEGGIVGEDMVPLIEALTKDENVMGVILRVNSGGGSAFASEQIWKALEDLKEKKPLFVSMGDYAASGGYYISCGAEKIYADPTTITGSIGIFGMIPNAQNLIEDKLGVNIDNVETNANANFPSLYAPMTAEQRDGMQTYVERGYELFVGRVAEGRGMTVDEVKKIGGGRVWTGLRGKEIGLVDELGTLDDAIAAMADKVGLKPNAYVCYPETTFPWMSLLSGAKVNVNFGGIGVDQVIDYQKAVQAIINADPLQARMNPIVVE